MKSIVIADRRPKIDVKGLIKAEQIELVITLGDLTREDLLPLETITDIPKIGVYGNHDSGNYMNELGIWDMHMKIWEFQGLQFGGFQGCVRYKKDPEAIMYTQAEAERMMFCFPKVDIFISHCPPFGINDEPEEVAHQGFKALRVYLDEQQPKVWLHGHTYPTNDELLTQIGSTRVEYVYEYRIIDL